MNPAHAPEHLERLRDVQIERATVVLDIHCDGCGTKIQATRKHARTLGWRTYWKTVHTGFQVQQDRCPNCPQRLVRFSLDD